ncbi:class I SAM-dependent methyltransferase [Rhodococcus pyridinivorans]|uniref:class I SAM-dependent methyltransferase n=1 Tax=Rhodococcus pyridinivorans TaxID=103816 RepID=UPI002078783E|nr:class I SAM-dependent methyltransferase [Rhodococcus pyridinivorans]USI91357.1 class I SAM-dependent methyltransferase [Rhodococcus pyridinivorans]
MKTCRGCDGVNIDRVLDLGAMPAADHFPPDRTVATITETSHPLAMAQCSDCGLAQLVDDDTVPDEPRGVEPRALRDQAAVAIREVADAGWLTGGTVIEFGSPHGGTWLPLLTDRGYEIAPATRSASLVIDSFGIMHASDQKAAFRQRAGALAANGTLLLQFHTFTAILAQLQWTALRHGHFAYYSLTTAKRLLANAGLHVADAWAFDLYGGTVLVAATPRPPRSLSLAVRRILAHERAVGVTDPTVARALQKAADDQALALRTSLTKMKCRGYSVYAYGAASQAVSLFSRARLDRRLLAGVADASPAKQGRRMPGTDIPIIPPDQLLCLRPDRVLLTLPDLLTEVQEQYPELDGRWRTLSDLVAPPTFPFPGPARARTGSEELP